MDRLLVANRGEIARRVFTTCRRLGISTVAVYSEPDADALFVREADLAVALGGSTPAESYLRSDAVIAAALATGADAIHPGYGFLSENAAFAQQVLDAGLTWVGPSPEAITAMGSKIGARERMEAAGVPVLPGAHLVDGEELGAAAERIGFPLLV
ncbi:MAG: acetyl/propionyl-CoA carboxylase subunit alpha, partial [Solirubrobacterales bacterium]|nr:acetyl/propionyl-CoA carboxylase subunit alpha [Solirubrobacterales bacterium]